jgi:hypothetical protein
MVALQRLNTTYFLVGYLGFVATWICDLILVFTQPPRLKAANTAIKVCGSLLGHVASVLTCVRAYFAG